MREQYHTQSDTFVLPRTDSATGQAIRYRIEPFVATGCLDDQSPPGPPLIPFGFPSGRLTVTP